MLPAAHPTLSVRGGHPFLHILHSLNSQAPLPQCKALCASWASPCLYPALMVPCPLLHPLCHKGHNRDTCTHIPHLPCCLHCHSTPKSSTCCSSHAFNLLCPLGSPVSRSCTYLTCEVTVSSPILVTCICLAIAGRPHPLPSIHLSICVTRLCLVPVMGHLCL